MPRQVLDGIRSRDDADSWVLPDDVLTETMQRLDAFAADHCPISTSRSRSVDASCWACSASQTERAGAASLRVSLHPGRFRFPA